MADSWSDTGKVQGKPVMCCAKKQERTQQPVNHAPRTEEQREEAPTGQFLEV